MVIDVQEVCSKSNSCCPRCGTPVEIDPKQPRPRKGKTYKQCTNCGTILTVKFDNGKITVKRQQLCTRALKDFKRKLFPQRLTGHPS